MLYTFQATVKKKDGVFVMSALPTSARWRRGYYVRTDGDVTYTHDAAGNVTRIERDGRPTLDLTWNSQYQLVSDSTNGGATYYSLTDVQGTVWGYVDSQNNVVARWQYDAWGNVISEEVAPSAAVLATLRYRFQGREWSAATGLINFRMRWYDSETGRWLSKDPIGLSGGLNLYAFCGGDAVNSEDGLGLSRVIITDVAGRTKIAKALSAELPNVNVSGNRRFAIGNKFGPTWNIGIRRTYVNGKIK